MSHKCGFCGEITTTGKHVCWQARDHVAQIIGENNMKEKLKVGDDWYVVLPGNATHTLNKVEIKSVGEKVVKFKINGYNSSSFETYKITDVEFVEKVKVGE